MEEKIICGVSYYLKSEVDAELKRIELKGWKGKDDLEIHHKLAYWEIIEHRKDKETGEVDELVKTIPIEDVEFLRNVLSDLFKTKFTVAYRDVVSEIIKRKNLSIDVNAFNGGTNRADYYFPFYYYPVKILELINEITYSGRGTIARKKK